MIKNLEQTFENFTAFLRRPLTFFICSPIIFFSLGILAFRFQPTDPDLWWHLNVGRDILKGGIHFQDIYTFTRPGYAWVDHEWLLNCLMFVLYKLTDNFLVLGIVFALISFLCFYGLAFKGISKPESDAGQIALWAGFFLSLLACLGCLGIRPQTFANLGICLITALVLSKNWHKTKNIIWLLPLGFAFWANLHGSLIIGLGLLTLESLFDFFTSSDTKPERFYRLRKKSLLIFLSFLATFLNPYGYRIYIELLTLFFDKYAHKNIDEWRPLNFAKLSPIFFFWTTYLFSFLCLFLWKLLFKKDVKLNTFNLALIALFGILAMRSVRHTQLLCLISLPIYVNLLELWLNSLIGKLPRAATALTLLFMGLLLSLFGANFAGVQINKWLDANINPKSFYAKYPLKALEFISENDLRGNVLAEYRWGGFIPWINPKMKIFIDGRMPSWDVGAPWEKKNQNRAIFREYTAIMFSEKNQEQILQKYEIEYLLMDKKLYSSHLYEGWTPVYIDEISLILMRDEKTKNISYCEFDPLKS